MPLVCFNRPNRKERRVWTAKKVGQVCGYALRDGSTVGDLQAELEECLGLPEQCDCAEIRNWVGNLLAALAAALIIIGQPRGVIVRSFIALVRVLARRIPALLPLLDYLQRLETARTLLNEALAAARRIEQLVKPKDGG